MAKAIVDPEHLRRFAHDLKRFNDQLHDQMASLYARMQELGSSWRDQEQMKFSEEFDQTMKTLARFIDHSNQHVPFLLRKAQRVEEYLNQG